MQWLSKDGKERKQQKFEQMFKGWAVGTRSFRKALREEHKELAIALKRGGHEP